MTAAYAANLTQILEREPHPAVGTTGSEVEYRAGDVDCAGYLAEPAGDGPHPAVLVVHDWLGVTDYVRMRADMLARLGYVAFAGDLYGAATRPSPAEASEVASGYYRDPELLRARVTAAFERLLTVPDVDRTRTAAIGYCFGGHAALQLARTGADLRSVVSFHGALQTGPDGEAAHIAAKLLILTGASDPVVPDDAVVAFENELRTVPDLDWQITTYAGAMHAFTIPDANSPEHGAVFDPRAERRSWQAMKDFLTETLS